MDDSGWDAGLISNEITTSLGLILDKSSEDAGSISNDFSISLLDNSGPTDNFSNDAGLILNLLLLSLIIIFLSYSGCKINKSSS